MMRDIFRNEDVAAQQQAEPIPKPTITTPDFPNPEFTCPKCFKAFGSAPALRMHHVRKHTKGWDTGANFKGKKKKGRGGTTGMKLGSWTPERRKQFQRTWASKKKAASRQRDYMLGKVNTPEPGKDTRTNNPGVMFCPRCGTNIKVIAAALAFGDKQ
jgi:hypothetical protein